VWASSVDSDGGSIRYELEIDTDPGFGSPLTVDTGSDTTYTLTTEEALAENLTYYWHVTAYDDDSNATTSNQVWSLMVDTTAPELVLGVLQHPYLDSYMDLYVASSEPLAELPEATLTIGGTEEEIDLELIDEDEELYYAPYEMSASGTALFEVQAQDIAGNSTSASDTFSIQVLRPAQGAAFSSPDEVLTVFVRSGTFQGRAYFLVKALPPAKHGEAAERPARGPALAPGPAGPGVAESRVYSVGWAPAGASLPVEIRFECGSQEDASVFSWNGAEWTELESYRNPDTGEVFAMTASPGLFQLRALPGGERTRATALMQNFPNPFAATTTVAFTVGGQGAASAVRIDVFDAKGRLVRKLLDAELTPGPYAVSWDGRDDSGAPCSGGVYFYRLTVEGERTQTRKMLLAR